MNVGHPTTGDDGSQPNGGEDAVRAAMIGLHRTAESIQLYTRDHPATHGAANESSQAISVALRQHPRFRVGVGDGEMLFGDGSSIDEKELRFLARTLRDAEIGAFEFNGPIGPDLIEEIALVIRRIRSEQLVGREFAEELESVSHGSLRAIRMTYGGLRVTDGIREGDDGAVDWPALVDRLLRRDPRDPELDPVAMAAYMSTRLSADDALEHQRHVSALAAVMHRTPEDRREEVVARLRTFVNALSPELRTALARIDEENLDASLSTLSQLSDVLPADEIIDALEHVDKRPEQLSQDAVLLLGKLVRTAQDSPDQMDRLRAIIPQWRGFDDDEADGNRSELKDAFESILHATQSTSEFTPEDYQKRLDKLTYRKEHASAFSEEIWLRWKNPSVHGAHVAALIIDDCLGLDAHDTQIDDLTGLIAYITYVRPKLVRANDLEPVMAAVNAARWLTAQRDNAVAVEAGEAFFADLASPEWADLLIEVISTYRAALPVAVSSLVDLAGPAALTAGIRSLSRKRNASVRGALLPQLQNDPKPLIIRTRESRSYEPGELDAILYLIDPLPPAIAHRVIEPLIAHPNDGIRRSAFRRLDESSGRWPKPVLAAALADPDEAVRARTLRRLGKQHGRSAAGLLTRFLDGELGPAVSPALYDMAARSIAKHGDSGVDALCHRLRLLSWKINRRTAEHGRILAEVLTPLRSRPNVEATLNRWRFSVARLAGCFRRRGSKVEATRGSTPPGNGGSDRKGQGS